MSGMKSSNRSGRSDRSWFVVACACLLAGSAWAQNNGVQVNTDPNTGQDIPGDAGNEPTIAVSPTNPDVMVIGWRDFPTITRDARFAGCAYSHDGGKTWTNLVKLDAPPGFPSDSEQTDPVLTVDASGVFYFWTELFRPVSATHHFIYRSFDDGVTWDVPTLVQDPATPGDKEWYICDRTGGIGDGHLYGGWNNFDLGGQCFVRSIDGGDSYSSPVRIADQGGTQWMMHFAVGPDGELYAAWRNMSRNAIYVTRSDKAKDPNQSPVFDSFGGGGNYGIDIRVDDSNDPGFLDVSPVGFHQIYIDVDCSDGPRRGWVYILWADRRNDVCDIYFARSTDGGFTWETGIRVNDDPIRNGAYQWMPSMSVAPNGRIDAVWFDSRNDTTHRPPHMELFYSCSDDGGSTWSTNERLTESFDARAGWPSQSKIGDYIQTVSDDGGVNIAYSATFNGGQDIYFLRKSLFSLEVGRLVAGQSAEFNVTGGDANTASYLAYSLKGEGNTFVPQLNVTLGLTSPKQAGKKKTSDGSGNVEWTLPVPKNASGVTLWFQAAQFEKVTNVVQGDVQ